MRKKKEMRKTITTVSCRIRSASWNREGCYSLEDALSGLPSAFMKRMNGHHFVSYFKFFLPHWFMFFFLSLILKCHIRRKNVLLFMSTGIIQISLVIMIMFPIIKKNNIYFGLKIQLGIIMSSAAMYLYLLF